MIKTAATKRYCRGCGADVREASVFCYNCGESVAGQPAVSTRIHAGAMETGVAKEISGQKPADEKFGVSEIADTKLHDVTNSKSEKLTKLQTASALRRRTKAFNRKPVEVVWIERGDSPAMFVIVTVVLTLFAGLLLFLALYLR